jgi:hypothetical protein
MKIKAQIVITVILVTYLLAITLTSFSLTGYWTDAIFTILLLSANWLLSLGSNRKKNQLLTAIKITNYLCSAFVVLILAWWLSNPFFIDNLKIRTFYFQKVDKRLFNAYFKPVGAYSGGYGNFWISETLIYFPMVEKRIYWERTVNHDFGEDTFDGVTIDNYQIVKEYIKEHIIETEKEKKQ